MKTSKEKKRNSMESKKFLNDILDSIQDGISIQDKDFRVLYQNQMHRDLTGGDHAGQYCYRAYEQNEAVCEGCPLAISLRDGCIHRAERISKDGAGHVEITTSPLRDAEGNIIAGIEVVRDITVQKRMQAELLKIEKMESLGTLAGGIAHEFNNLLTAIMGNISLAKMYTEPGLELHGQLTEAEAAAVRARALTQQLLTLSRGGEPVKKTIFIGGLLKDSCFFALKDTNIICECDVDEDLLPVEADEGQIKQIINNLAKNAQQAMPEGGTLRIKATNTAVSKSNAMPLIAGEYIKIDIADNGIGIPKEHLPKIFDPFFTTKQKGGGLGLASSYSIIVKHGGHITAESEPGSGTTFHIYLPASKKTLSQIESAGETFFRGAGRILLMDDEQIIRTVVSRMLEQCGYEAETANDGSEMLEKYIKAKDMGKPFDAVIIDIVIESGMGGREAIGKLLEADPDATAIVSSGYSNDPVMANYMDSGFKGVLAKPYGIEELKREIRKITPRKS
jgi:PAS domain S-box-containing protein